MVGWGRSEQLPDVFLDFMSNLMDPVEDIFAPADKNLRVRGSFLHSHMRLLGNLTFG